MIQLKTGDTAPAFKLSDQNENVVTLDTFKGAWLIVYFYPRDNTPGCTIEAKDFTCLQDEFDKLDIKIIGISKDSISSHQRFIDKHSLNLTLLSDPELVMMKAYGVWKEKKLYGKTAFGVVRSTFLITPEGNIQKAWYNVRAKNHAQRILDHCKSFIKL